MGRVHEGSLRLTLGGVVVVVDDGIVFDRHPPGDHDDVLIIVDGGLRNTSSSSILVAATVLNILGSYFDWKLNQLFIGFLQKRRNSLMCFWKLRIVLGLLLWILWEPL